MIDDESQDKATKIREARKALPTLGGEMIRVPYDEHTQTTDKAWLLLFDDDHAEWVSQHYCVLYPEAYCVDIPEWLYNKLFDGV